MNPTLMFSTFKNSIVLAALVFANLTVAASAAEYVEIGTSLSFRLLSADGNVVAGTGGDLETWTWSRTTGFTQVMPTRADVYVNLNSISRDGSVLVGAEREASFGGFNQAFRWTEETGSVLLDPTVEFGRSQASGLTNSGTVVGSFGDPAGGGRELFQWKDGDAMKAIEIPEVPLIFNSPVVSDDGAVIAGAISNFVQPNGNVTAFVWNRTTGRVENLGVLPGYRVSRSSDISSDGTIVVGSSADPASEAYRWTEATGMQGLGMLPGDTESASSGVSDDGKVIFGISRRREGGDSITTDVVWDEQLQIHDLLKLVNDHAEINETPTLSDVYAVSSDQRTIVGEVGDSLVAVYLDRPLITLICDPNSMGDLDGNGKVEFADFLTLSSNFGLDSTHHSTGDIDCNGTVDFTDFLILSNNFGQSVTQVLSVPEPASSQLAALLAIFCGLFLRGRACHRRKSTHGKTSGFGRSVVSLSLIVPACFTSTQAGAVEYVEIGPMSALLVSGDGRVIYGQGGDLESWNWTWTRDDGFTAVMHITQAGSFTPNAISNDGSIMVGKGLLGGFGGFGDHAMRWTPEFGAELLDPNDQLARTATDVSDLGIIVGAYGGDPGGGGREVFQWTDEDGLDVLEIAGVPLIRGSGTRISNDGNVVSLWRSDQFEPFSTAFVWDKSTNVVADLGVLPGDEVSRVLDLSADGSVAVGRSGGAGGWEAFRWTRENDLQGLGFLPGHSASSATDVTSDGKLILGSSRGSDGSTPVAWDEHLQIYDLLDLLNNHPALSDVPSLTQFDSISDDQMTIVGKSEDTLLAIYLDSPLFDGLCDANSMGDLDGNGKVEFVDFLVLSSNFGQPVEDHTSGDIDCNGTVNFADFLILSDNFGKNTAAITAVPEPSSVAPFALAGWLMVMLTRRNHNQSSRKPDLAY